MKHVMAVALVMALLATGICSVFAEGNTITIETLKELYARYRSDPDSFGAEEIVNAYSCYQKYMSDKFEWFINNLSKESDYWEGKTRIVGDLVMINKANEYLGQWASKEISDAECIKMIMAYINLEIVMNGD